MSNTVDPEEIERFSRMASQWWNPEGKFKPLHRMNPLRIGYIRDQVIKELGARDWGLENVPVPSPQQPLAPFVLLDIGCGGGLISEPMARLGAQVTAIDASEKNIAVAGLHAQAAGLEIDYRCMSAEELSTECTVLSAEKENHSQLSTQHSALFDIILALEIIEHVADVEAFVAASCALLKPGGLIFYSTLNRTPKSYALAILGAEYLLRWLPVGTHNWKKFLRPHELVNPLRRNGIDITDMTGMVFNPLNGKWRLDAKDLDVNYILVGRKTQKS